MKNKLKNIFLSLALALCVSVPCFTLQRGIKQVGAYSYDDYFRTNYTLESCVVSPSSDHIDVTQFVNVSSSNIETYYSPVYNVEFFVHQPNETQPYQHFVGLSFVVTSNAWGVLGSLAYGSSGITISQGYWSFSFSSGVTYTGSGLSNVDWFYFLGVTPQMKEAIGSGTITGEDYSNEVLVSLFLMGEDFVCWNMAQNVITLQDDISSLQEDYDYLDYQYGYALNQISSLNSEVSDLTNENNDLIDQVYDLEIEIGQLENDIAWWENQFNVLQSHASQVSQELNNYKASGHFFDLMGSAFTSITDFLSISIAPGISIGLLICIPLAVGIILFVIKLISG